MATVDADGNFAFTMPPVDVASFAFLADGSNDGVIDGGDPIAVLTGPSFANLGGGETVVLADVALDFAAHKATAANIDVQRGGAPRRCGRRPRSRLARAIESRGTRRPTGRPVAAGFARHR